MVILGMVEISIQYTDENQKHMSIKRLAYDAFSKIYCLYITHQSSYRNGLRILLYHSVDSRLPHDSYGISIAKNQFERHIHELMNMTSFLSVISLQHIDRLNINTKLHIAITFDDGYRDNLYIAAPILLKYKIPFTVFVTTSFLRSNSAFYLTIDDLKELSGLEGVTIGSHGTTHKCLTTCNDKELWEELYGSRCYLEDITGKPVKTISYPHGSVDNRVCNMTEKAEYKTGCCSMFGINNQYNDKFLLKRTEVIKTDTVDDFTCKIYGGWDWYRWKQEIFETKALAKTKKG
ncbi:MAG: polysaccharide deacetylase family protein [Nitrospirae bacterium]|nr:polysaccharide deacetylase family protein [Nitrospirota bacterium]